MKFGDVVRWKPDPRDDASDGRYMVVGWTHVSWANQAVEVVCLLPPDPSDWEIGIQAPCDAEAMEIVH